MLANFSVPLFVAAVQSHGLGGGVSDNLLQLHRAADAVTALSYFGIAATLAYLVHHLRRQLPFGQLFLLFGAFIVLCGAMHLTSVLMLGTSAPRLVVVISAATAAVSLLTALILPSYIPKVAAFAANAEAAHERDLAKARAAVLEEVNLQLIEQAQVLEGTNALLAESLEARHSLEQQFQATFEQAAIGIAHLSLDGRWLRVNPALRDILGSGISALLGSNHEAVTHPDDRAGDATNLEALRQGHLRNFTREKRFLTADGDIVWTNVTVTLVHDRRSAPAYFIAVVKDIRARKAVESALRDASRRKDHFLAILAHELRNPLAPIRAGVELLQEVRMRNSTVQAAPDAAADAAPDRSVAERVLPMIERQIAHMTRLLDDLLDASRLDHDKVELHLQQLDAAELVRQTAETMRPLLEQRGQTLQTTIAGSPLIVVADPVRVTQMLTNLLDNAAKFTERGGRIELRACQEDDTVVLTVRDTGIGLAPEHLARIFDAFAQIESALSRTHGGLGIGLSLVRAFAERQGASVQARSEGPGRGSEFIIRFPAFQEPIAHDAGVNFGAHSTPVSDARMRVLVVDDSLDASTTMAALVATTGRDVRAVQDGESALRVANEFHPDTVLLDLGMPGMDGFETCRRMRALDGGAETVIIALTGWGRDEDRARTREAGFDQHLVKPADRAAIIRALEHGATASR